LEPTDPVDGLESRSEPTDPVAVMSAVASEIPPAPVSSEAPWEQGVSTLPAGGDGIEPPPPKRSRVRLVLIGAGILLIAGIVIGITIAFGGGGKTPVADLSPTAATQQAPPPTVAPPVEFAAKGQTSPFGVALSWSAPVGQSVQGYRIFRAGFQVAAVPSDTTTYLDPNVAPGQTYTYEILTRGEGLFQSSKVSTEVKVPVPTLASARLDGSFSVKFKTTSQSGYVGTLGGFTLGWDFNPKCRKDACDVTLKDQSIKDLKTTLSRNGINYSGTDSAKFIGSCGGVPDTSTLTVELHVVKARIIEGEWRATKLVGTVVESHPAISGCTSGGAHFNVTATFTG
jgi:hypothetical protein